MDMSTGEISKNDTKFEAMTLYRAYQKFQKFLIDSEYQLKNTTKVQPIEYLLVGKKEPVVSSSIIKCVMKPKIIGRDTCSQETMDALQGDYNLLQDMNQFETQAMIGWGLKEDLLDFSPLQGNKVGPLAEEVASLTKGEKDGRFYLMQNLETKQYKMGFQGDLKKAEALFALKVKEGA